MKIQKVALYARFSSDNQRTESIDAQVRAMKKYCLDNHWRIIETYIDEAKSAMSDKRPSFQQMIEDSGKGLFDIILVHKLDRFSRNRYDSAMYKSKLKKNNIKLFSVLERIDDSPESIMMESVLEGMAEYYSKNLARETMKGMTETALQCRHTGGIPPLGYNLDSEKRLIINEFESEAVKMIYDLYDKGYGYTYIINKMNELGYQTKRGNIFGKNSIHEILSNEKYTGTYIFNKVKAKDYNNRRNNHKYKPYDDIIRIENGCPQIISKELFARIQAKKERNKHSAGAYHSKEFYLLSGNVICGICGKRMQGNLKFSGRNKLRLSTYRCNNHRIVCKNKELNKDWIDSYIIKLLSEKLFNEKSLKLIINKLNKYIDMYNSEYDNILQEIQSEYDETLRQIQNITYAVEKGIITEALIERSENLEQKRVEFEYQLKSIQPQKTLTYGETRHIIDDFYGIGIGTEYFKTFVGEYIEAVVIYPYHLDIKLRTGLGIADELNEITKINRGELYQIYKNSTKG